MPARDQESSYFLPLFFLFFCREGTQEGCDAICLGFVFSVLTDNRLFGSSCDAINRFRLFGTVTMIFSVNITIYCYYFSMSIN